MTLKRVVVTGLGAITPLGNTVEEYWKNLINGVSGAANITRFDASEFKTKFACEVKGFNAEDFLSRKDARKLDPYTHYAIAASDQAINDSNIDKEKVDLDRVGVIWASGIGGINTFYDEVKEHSQNNPPRFNPFFIPKVIADIASGHISIRHQFRGPNFATVSACASSTHSLIDAYNFIRLGKSNIIVAGGSEAAVNEAGIGGFNALHALSTNNESPTTASKPFDKDRDGFVLGEGAGALILEELDHALARGAKIYAEIIGSGATADAYHMTAPHPEGLGAKNVMIQALEDANVDPEVIDYINVHGTSTPLGDTAELKAIQHVFGDHAYKMNISSTKSMTGHLLGAAGAIEAIACTLSITKGIVPPTINHNTKDPEIDDKLNLTLNKAQERTVNCALSNTFGFGGHNASVILKKYG